MPATTPVSTVGEKNSPLRAWPPITARAPFATASRTCAVTFSRPSPFTSGPTWVWGSIGSPTRKPSTARVNRLANSSWMPSCT